MPLAALHPAFTGIVRPKYSTVRQHYQPDKLAMACRAISLFDTLAAAASRPSLSNWSRCKIISNRTQLSGDSATEKTRVNLIGVRGGWMRGLPGRRLTGSVIFSILVSIPHQPALTASPVDRRAISGRKHRSSYWLLLGVLKTDKRLAFCQSRQQ